MASPETISSALLLASLSSLSTPHFLAPAIVSAATAAHDRLCIVLFSRLFDADAISHTQKWHDVQRLLTYVYVQATKVAQDMDKILMHVDVLLKGVDEKDKLPESFGEGWGMVYRVAGDSIPADLPTAVLGLPFRYISIDTAEHASESSTPPQEPHSYPSLFPVVALGGTFDHLHAGHKILLSMAAWIASEKIIVGVTDSALLKNKANVHLLESLELRQEKVRSFLALFRPGVVYDIVPISDVYGPTGWDPNIQGLVVSRETISGAEMIAAHRAKKELPALTTFIIDVISHSSANITDDDLELMRQTKMGSTLIRQWIAVREDREKEKKAASQLQRMTTDGVRVVERGELGWIGHQDE